MLISSIKKIFDYFNVVLGFLWKSYYSTRKVLKIVLKIVINCLNFENLRISFIKYLFNSIQQRLRPIQQPVPSRPDRGRIFRRRSRIDRFCRIRFRGRIRCRRLDPNAGILLRDIRTQADDGTRFERWTGTMTSLV